MVATVPRAAVDPVEVAIRYLLVNDPALGPAVGGRVYQLILPPNVAYPAVRLQLVDEISRGHTRGADDLRRARVQVDVYGTEAAGYSAITAIGELASAALLNQAPRYVESTGLLVVSAALESRRVIFEAEELRLIRVLQDFLIWSRP